MILAMVNLSVHKREKVVWHNAINHKTANQLRFSLFVRPLTLFPVLASFLVLLTLLCIRRLFFFIFFIQTHYFTIQSEIWINKMTLMDPYR